MKRALFLTIILLVLGRLTYSAAIAQDEPPYPLDTFRISFGPEILAIPGDPDFQLPLRIHVTQPTVRINLLFSYDPTILTPVLLAPNFFVQGFSYDLSTTGRIQLAVVTDLSPPPYVPPILGDTVFGWISWRVTSRYIGYDYLTHVGFYEDPQTPYPDNYIVLENNDIIAQPMLELIPGDVLVWFPLYGDINDNTYPWEIGDAVTFLNFFMGLTNFTRRQYANSDCNRDGVQASISDLVYLLRVINDDSMMTPSELPEFNRYDGFIGLQGISKSSMPLASYENSYELVINDEVALGGASFVFDLSHSPESPLEIKLDPRAEGMSLFWSLHENLLHVTVLDWNGRSTSFHGGRLFSIGLSGQAIPIKIVKAEFSTEDGRGAAPAYKFEKPGNGSDNSWQEQSNNTLSLSGYPNPFNGQVSVSFYLAVEGYYELSVYDITGRKIKTLIAGPMPSGPGSVIWNATDDSKSPVASGAYFLRLRGEDAQSTAKLYFLK